MATFRKQGAKSPFLEFIKEYWYILIGLFLAFPYLLKWFGQLGANFRAADAAGEIKDKQTQTETKIKTIKIQQQANSSENATLNPSLQKSKSDNILKTRPSNVKDRLNSVTVNLAVAMGYLAGTPWWDITSWTEDDRDVAKILTDNWYYIKDIEKLYYNVYTESRNLKADVIKKLDSSDLKRVRTYYKSKGLKTFG